MSTPTPEPRRRAVRVRRPWQLSSEPETPQQQADRRLDAWLRENRRRAGAMTQCRVRKLELDVEEPALWIDFAGHGDASGVWKLAAEVAPEVSRIYCASFGTVDLVFRRSASGVWRGTLVQERA